jgi:hypothetical protein
MYGSINVRSWNSAIVDQSPIRCALIVDRRCSVRRMYGSINVRSWNSAIYEAPALQGM